ncbi:M23 family metallopeptidase [Ralstonia soli]|uniref:M23 family metallopeptidase n=1 Tax=Ralstonia soli TaxID=2953896 RepID=A0ABT1AGN9_9RALS|nr:M23 family metallopeptidase [Ralstonia soli]MCO5397559.1 M23 family metallopeptidase [Ralstonia soli]
MALLAGFVTAVVPVAVFGVMSTANTNTPAPTPPAIATRDLFGVPAQPSQPDARAGAITTTLRHALAQADLPGDLSQQILRLLRGSVDASAQASPGDYFRVIYEPAGDGCCGQDVRMTALEVQLRGSHHSGVWFATAERPQGDYYRFDGTLMAGLRFTFPVVATRVSSTFGGRVHPVSGTQHVHSGVDLAAPKGRAVHASADGVVSHIGNDSRGYGKYVVIRHANGYASYYAHLSKIERGLRNGMRVTRAQRVGAVGSTGTATGPHLHFEVKRGDRPIDPLALIRKTNVSALRGEQLAAFQRVASVARMRLAAAGPDALTAANKTGDATGRPLTRS